MAKFKASSFALDIGSRYIKFVELKKSKDTIILNKIGIKEIPKDANIDVDKLVLQLILQIISENRIRTNNIKISVSGQAVFIRFVKLMQVKEDKLSQTMKFEAQNQIPFALNEVSWDWSLLGADDKQAKKAVIVAIKKTLIEDIVSRLDSIKLNIDLIDVAPISLYNCMVFNGDYTKESLGAVVDIQAKSTNFIIYNKDDVWIRSFPIGSDKIEEIGAEGIDELISELSRSVEYYFMQSGEEAGPKKKLEELILTGGGAGLKDIEAIFNNRLNIKPRFMDVFRELKVTKEAAQNRDIDNIKNQFSTVIGLALRGLTPLKIEVNFLKETIAQKVVTLQKRLYTSLSISIIVLMSAGFYIFMNQDYAVRKVKLDKVDEMIELYKTYEPKIKKMQEREDVLKGRIGTLYQTALSRSIWLDVLKNISEIIPQDIWITDVSGVVSIEKSSFGRLDLNGRALSYQSVNNFVSMLKSSKNFKEVKPVSSSVEKDIKTQEEIVRFSITMDVVAGDS